MEAGCEQMPTEECGGTCGGGLKSLRFSGTREPKLQGYDVCTWWGDFEQRLCSCGRLGPFLSLGMTSLGDRTLATEIQGRQSLTT